MFSELLQLIFFNCIVDFVLILDVEIFKMLIF